jgi:hypothetical protein
VTIPKGLRLSAAPLQAQLQGDSRKEPDCHPLNDRDAHGTVERIRSLHQQHKSSRTPRHTATGQRRL